MDKNINPATLNTPGTQAPVLSDKDTNPAVAGPKIGGTTAPNPNPDVPQTTINPNTTINPDASILNPVTPDGGPAPGVKPAAPHPSIAAEADEQVKQMQAKPKK